MTKQEFIEQVKQNYEGKGDLGLYDCDDDDEIIIPLVDVKVTFDDDGTFNIYRDFCYPTRDYEENFENAYRTILQENTVATLELKFKNKPCEEYECGYGCPFDTCLVGYWNKTFDIDFIVDFINGCLEAENNVNEDDVAKLIIESISEDAEKFKLVKIDDDLLINTRKTVILFAKDISQIGLGDINSRHFEIIEHSVSATHYFCGKLKSGKIFAYSGHTRPPIPVTFGQAIR